MLRAEPTAVRPAGRPAPAPAFRPAMPPLPMPEVIAAAAPTPAPATPAPLAPVAEPAPVVAAAPTLAQRMLPASAVQYLEPPVLVYPRMSRRAGEAGRVLLRVFIDEEGRPRQVQVDRSSGFARLDEAAIEALRKARFKPCIADGQPVAGWAVVPLSFELQA
jgi:protein TonB